MKELCLTITAFFMVLQVVSAQKHAALYEESLAKFEAGKKQHGNSYTFSIKYASFTGAYTETTFVVQSGQVAERRYKTGHYHREKWEHAKEWVERGAEVGSHKDEGERVQTMDEVYKSAKSYAEGADENEAEKKDGKAAENDNKPIIDPNDYYFSVGKNGLIDTAGYRPRGCMDDCFRGYHISAFAWGVLPDAPKDKKGKKGKGKK